MFYNRDQVLKALLETIRTARRGRARHMALVGPRKAGKTSLLFQIRREIRDDPEVLPLYFYIKPEPSKLFLNRFLISRLGECLRRKGLEVEEVLFPTEENLEELLGRGAEVLPRTVGRILQIQRLSSPEEILSSLFLLLGVVQEEMGGLLVAMLDEFQRLSGFGVRHLFDDFREVLSSQRGVLYLLSGSAVGMMMALVGEKTAPLFGHFELVRIGNFAYEDAKGFLLDRLGGRIALKEMQVDFLFFLTGGFPFYLDVLADRIVRLASEKALRRAPRALVVEALVEELFRETGTIYQYIRETIEQSIERRGLGTYLAILSAIAGGGSRVSAISKACGMQMPAVPYYLRRLMEAGLVVRRNGEYFLTDRLMGFWLSWVYALREGSYVRDLEAELAYFKDQIGQMIESYRSELGQAREAQIRQLFSKMGIFGRVEGGVLQGEEFDLLAWLPKGGLWVGEVKLGFFGRGDFGRFAAKCRKLEGSYSIVRRIAFALSGYDATLEEISQKEGVEVWTLEEVNRQMEKYSLRRIRL